jgi:hypothetical protein
MLEHRKQVWLSYEVWFEDDIAHLLLGREPLAPFLAGKPDNWESLLCAAKEAVQNSGLVGKDAYHGVEFNPQEVIAWANKNKEWPLFPFLENAEHQEAVAIGD